MIQDDVANSNTEPQHIASCDYITIVHMDVPTGKLYEVDPQGQIIKTPAANNAAGIGFTRHCPDLETLKQINEEISNDIHKAIILGFIDGTQDGTPYRLMSVRNFEAFAIENGLSVDKFNNKPIDLDGMKYATRTKRMFHPSTIMLFDKDAVEGMPKELKPDAPFNEWWQMMTTCFPEISNTDYLVVPSASSRVLLNDVPVSSGNVHVYMQVKHASDVEAFGRAALIQSFLRHNSLYGYMRPIFEKSTGKEIGQRPWTLFDPTTFSMERLCFDGSPIVDPNSIHAIVGMIKVRPSVPMLFKGTHQRVNTFALPKPTQEEQRSLDLQFSVGKGGRVKMTNMLSLTPDIILDAHNRATGEYLKLTMEEFVNGPVDRLSVNSPFRPDSSSWAAFISKEDDCKPFLFDVGTHTSYQYNDVVDQFQRAGVMPVDAMNGVVENEKVNEVVTPVRASNNDGGSFNEYSGANVHGIPIDNSGNVTIPIDNSGNVTIPIDNSGNVTIPTVEMMKGLPPVPEAAAQLLPLPLPLPLSGPSQDSQTMQPAAPQQNLTNPGYGALHRTSPEFAESEMANAQRFVGTYSHTIRYVPMYKSWFNWIGHRWEQCDGGVEFAMAHKMIEVMVDEAAQRPDSDTFRKWAKSSCSANAVRNMLSMASVMPEMVIKSDDVDNHWYQFGVGNGYVDLRMRDDGSGLIGFNEPDREVFITKSSHIDYQAGAQCPEWQKMIWEIFSGNAEVVNFFQRMVGYTMIGKPLEEATFFLVGEGSNGKSTITAIMQELLGEYKATVNKSLLMSVERTSGESPTPALARLKGIRMAVITETREGDVLDESMIKSLSGSDTIVARHLHSEPFEYQSMFVTWLPTNHPPIIKSEDFGTWRRVIEIPFKRNFAKELGDQLDKNIGDRIRANEMPGILNWALEGVRLYQTIGLKPPIEVMTATKNYKDNMDVLANWLEDCCEVGDNYYASTKLLWESYEKYTQQTGDQLIHKGYTLAKKLHNRGFIKIKHMPGDNNSRGFSGLRLKFGDIPL